MLVIVAVNVNILVLELVLVLANFNKNKNKGKDKHKEVRLELLGSHQTISTTLCEFSNSKKLSKNKVRRVVIPFKQQKSS